MRACVLYHEGVFGEEVSTWHSGGPGWCAWVRCRGPSTEPAADSPNYEDSEESRGEKKDMGDYRDIASGYELQHGRTRPCFKDRRQSH